MLAAALNVVLPDMDTARTDGEMLPPDGVSTVWQFGAHRMMKIIGHFRPM
jgi:hypothetical protein